MDKLIVCYIGQNVEGIINLSLDSIKDIADHIVFIDGGSTDKTLSLLDDYCFKEYNEGMIEIPEKIFIRRPYEKEIKEGNGRARNFYLKFIQKYFNGDWCLVLDPDEVVENPHFFKNIIKENKKVNDCLFSIKMRHLIGDLGHEDSTVKEHFVQHRFFKITDNLFYPEIEHPVLNLKNMEECFRVGQITGTVIWHLPYWKTSIDLRGKYLSNLKKSDMHTPKFLQWWYYSHLFGDYPRKEVIPINLPKIIKDEFLVDDDYFYFKDRMILESKHLIDCWTWKDFFNPKNVLDIGCGVGHKVSVMGFYGVKCTGIDRSKWCIDYTPYKGFINIHQGDITDNSTLKEIKEEEFDLIICYDILEHLQYEKLDDALKNIYNLGSKYFIFSIPFLGNEHLDDDFTHIIKESKEWWIDKITKNNIKILPVPDNFIFKEQLIIGEKVE